MYLLSDGMYSVLASGALTGWSQLTYTYLYCCFCFSILLFKSPVQLLRPLEARYQRNELC